MKILVLGCNGQLGRCLNDQLHNSTHEVVYTSREQIDIVDFKKTKNQILRISPDLIINATAYTAVDTAEDEHQIADLVNHLAIANMASICNMLGCWLFHMSTDYVFDGSSRVPYTELDGTNPQGVYGETKLNGELSILSSGCKHIILRTAWVFSEYGNNFLKTMLLLGKNQDELRVVNDQIGCPTSGHDIARVLISILPYLERESAVSGIYHFCGGNHCSWYDFSLEIFKIAKIMGYSTPKKVHPVDSIEFPTKAIRPPYSVLDISKLHLKFNIRPVSLDESIALVISKL